MPYRLSEEEKCSGNVSSETLSAIIGDIRRFGYAVVEDLISEETCELLTESVLEDVELIRATGEQTTHEKLTGEGHLQLGLRRYAPYVRADLVANNLIECIVAGVLGPEAWLGFYNGNVNCPGSAHQPLHFDRPSSWKTPEDAAQDGKSWPPPATSLSCSIALEEITEENGATEIYPGTHRETEVIGWPPGERLSNHPELVQKWAPPRRMAIPAGSVCFRDPRMWHRGVPNSATMPRAMIAATYHARSCKHWRGIYVQDLEPHISEKLENDPSLRIMDDGELGDGRLVFQSDVRAVFESTDNPHRIDRNVRFIDPPERVNHFHDAHMPGGAGVVQSAEISPRGE